MSDFHDGLRVGFIYTMTFVYILGLVSQSGLAKNLPGKPGVQHKIAL